MSSDEPRKAKFKTTKGMESDFSFWLIIEHETGRILIYISSANSFLPK